MSTDSKTLLVTGVTGLVMSHLALAWLKASPNNRVLGIDLNAPDEVVQRFLSPIAERLRFLEGDIRDPLLWKRIEKDYSVTHAVHGATVTSINRLIISEGEIPDLTPALPALESNLMGTLQALSWAGRQRNLARFIYVSSGSVYCGNGPSPLPEEGYVAPEGFYATTKYCGELLTRQAVNLLGFNAVVVRLSGVYAGRERWAATIPTQLLDACEAVLTRRKATL